MMGKEMRNDGRRVVNYAEFDDTRRGKRKNGRGEGMRIEEGWDEGR